MPTISNAPNGADSSIDGTEKIAVSGSKYALISSILEYIRTATATLTGKTINLTSNTLSGTTAQFNTALSDNDFATLAGSENLTNKTLTTPTIASFTNATHSHADAAGGSSIPVFKTIAVSGQSDVVADSVTDTLTLAAGANVTITTNASTDTITIASSGGGGGGDVATDTIWDAKGDLAIGTGADTAAKLTVGSNGQYVIAASGETTGLKYVTGGRVFIEEVTGSGTTLTFGASGTIPQVYTSLEIEYELRSTKAAVAVEVMKISFNNDTTAANYRYTEEGIYGAGSEALAGADDLAIDNLPAATSPANSASTGFIRIPFYKATTFFKKALQMSGSRLDTSGTQLVIYTHAVEWENTGAITEIDLILASGNFTGTARLYGTY
jgi:hypothetical protein